MHPDSEHRGREFAEVEQSALAYLMHPHEVPKAQSLDAWRPVLLLWHFPSFYPHRSWGVFRRREHGGMGDCALVRQLTWDYGADYERFVDPLTGLREGFHVHPTLEVRDRPLDAARIDAALSALRAISFPAFSGGGLGIDGDVYGVADPLHRLSVEWWCDGPESWGSLTAWAHDVRVWLGGVASAAPSEETARPFRPRLP